MKQIHRNKEKSFISQTKSCCVFLSRDLKLHGRGDLIQEFCIIKFRNLTE